jgi:G:T-mismatch repair DNA endonuclease (very short patch repair protein)
MQFAKRRENIIKHGDYECEKCSKKFETNLSLRSHRSYCNHDDRQPTVCEICGVILKVKRALAMHMRKHDATWKANHSKVVSMALANRKPPKRISDEENKFYERLRTLYGNEVTHSFRIDGVNHEFDFFVPSKNLLIEYDGDYWHGNKATQQILTPAMKRQFRIDEKFTRAAEKAGYVVHRVWGSESKQYPSKRRTEFNDFINKD